MRWAEASGDQALPGVSGGARPASGRRPVPSSARERGVALILVLGFLSVILLIMLHLTTISEVASEESKVLAERGRLRYLAESAADRAFWLVLNDRRLPPPKTADAMTPNLWKVNGPTRSFSVGAADDSQIVWSDAAAAAGAGEAGAAVVRGRVEVRDVNGGFDFSGAHPDVQFREQAARLLPTDGTQSEADLDAVNRFLDVLGDYADADDLVRLRGCERRDYEADDLPALPRDGPLQFRDEVYWLAGLPEFLAAIGTDVEQLADPSAVRPIPPPGTSAPRRSGKPSFFSSPLFIVVRAAGLDPSEAALAEAARRNWFAQGAPVVEALPAALYAKLSERFSFDESDVATILVTVGLYRGDESGGDAAALHPPVIRALRLTRLCAPAALRANPARPWLVNWERFLDVERDVGAGGAGSTHDGAAAAGPAGAGP